MKIKEFLVNYISKTDNIAEDYLKDYPPFEDYELEYMLKENGKEYVEKAFSIILEKMNNFLSSIQNIIPSNSDMIVFVCKEYETFYNDKRLTFIDSFSCYKEEIIKKVPDGISLWGEENRIEHYAYDFSPRAEILGMDLFIDDDVSEKDAFNHIINEMTSFSIDENIRENKINEIVESLRESVEDIEQRREKGEPIGIPAEEVFAELQKEIWEQADDEGKARILKEKEEKEKNRNRDNTYIRVIMSLNHKIKISVIEKWYLNIINTLNL